MVEKNNIYQLELLKHVEETPRLNNRMAAAKLGCSVKLAHELLSKMVDKGLFHVKKHHARRWDYFLTPKGITEKARLTYEFLDFSMHFYREARKKSSQLCKNLKEKGIDKVSFIGAGDLAEIVYLGVKEWGLELVNVYAESEKESFMGIDIKLYDELIRLQPISNRGEATNLSNNYHLSIETLAEEKPSTNFIVCLYNKTHPTQKSKFLPERLDLYINQKSEIRNKFHWIF